MAALLSGLWVLSDAEFFWPAIPLLFLGLGLVRHARFGRYRFAYSYQHRLGSQEHRPGRGPDRHWRLSDRH